MIVKRTFVHTFGHGGSVEVPAGTRLERNHFDGGYWVDPSSFAPGTIARHDADHYGIRVGVNNAMETE
jgi:hypothetical protein